MVQIKIGKTLNGEDNLGHGIKSYLELQPSKLQNPFTVTMNDAISGSVYRKNDGSSQSDGLNY